MSHFQTFKIMCAGEGRLSDKHVLLSARCVLFSNVHEFCLGAVG